MGARTPRETENGAELDHLAAAAPLPAANPSVVPPGPVPPRLLGDRSAVRLSTRFPSACSALAPGTRVSLAAGRDGSRCPDGAALLLESPVRPPPGMGHRGWLGAVLAGAVKSALSAPCFADPDPRRTGEAREAFLALAWEVAGSRGIEIPAVLAVVDGDPASVDRARSMLPAGAEPVFLVVGGDGDAGMRGRVPGPFSWVLAALAGRTVIASSSPYGLDAVAICGGGQVAFAVETEYSGWVGTERHASVPARLPRRSRGEVAAAALVLLPCYTDPFTGQAVSVEQAIQTARLWHGLAAQDAGIAAVCGVARWKRRNLAEMMPFGDVRHVNADAAIKAARISGRAVLAWAPGLAAASSGRASVVRVEDGFIRSAGLGSECVPPCSVVFDRIGMHYDPSVPSDLEEILAHTEFSPRLVRRAADLRRSLVEARIGKYGVSGPVRPYRFAPIGRKFILVIGQVADDRSVIAGGCGIDPGIGLLRRVRGANPGAWIVYKPHPDVEAGLRRGLLDGPRVREFVDLVARHTNIEHLLACCEEVHTLTSLAGFEALMRGRRVVVYGQPFYAGWGLTTDMNPHPRRSRRLSIDELVAGAMILYPRYLDPVSRLPCPPEVLVDRLAAGHTGFPGMLVALRRAQSAAARALRAAGKPS